MKKNILKLSALALTVAFFSCSKDEPVVDNTPPIIIPVVSNDQMETDIQTDLEIDGTSEIALSLHQKFKANFTQKNKNNVSETCQVSIKTDGVTTFQEKNYNVYFYDYGTGCTQPNGAEFKGIIKIYADLKDLDNVVFIYDNFEVNGKISNGYIKISNSTINTNQAKIIIEQDFTIKFPNLGTFKRVTDTNITRTYLTGYDTPDDMTDDVFNIDGSWTTTFPDADATKNEVKITKSILFKNECPNKYTSGTINFTRNLNPATIDFGNELLCNSPWTIKRADGKEFEVTPKENK